MVCFTRSFRRRSLAALAALMLMTLLIASTTAPAAHAEKAPAVVAHETMAHEGAVGSAAWMTAVASSFGPGLWGNRTACGQRLTPTTIGVAHRKMRCGTRLKFLGKNGVVVTATVIDRGPYIAGRTFDLTQAMVQQMGYASSRHFGVRSVAWDYN